MQSSLSARLQLHAVAKVLASRFTPPAAAEHNGASAFNATALDARVGRVAAAKLRSEAADRLCGLAGRADAQAIAAVAAAETPGAADVLAMRIIRHEEGGEGFSLSEGRAVLSFLSPRLSAETMHWAAPALNPHANADLCWAASHGDTAAMESAVAAGADVAAMSGEDGRTPLFLAAKGGFPDATRWLLERGAQPFPPTLLRPLSAAVANEAHHCVALMLSANAQPPQAPERAAQHIKLALEEAVSSGHERIAGLLAAHASQETRFAVAERLRDSLAPHKLPAYDRVLASLPESGEGDALRSLALARADALAAESGCASSWGRMALPSALARIEQQEIERALAGVAPARAPAAIAVGVAQPVAPASAPAVSANRPAPNELNQLPLGAGATIRVAARGASRRI